MQRLDSDVRNPYAPDQCLTVWQQLNSNQRDLEHRTREMYATHSLEHAAAAASPAGCFHCGWTLPHLSHAAVDAVRPMLCCVLCCDAATTSRAEGWVRPGTPRLSRTAAACLMETRDRNGIAMVLYQGLLVSRGLTCPASLCVLSIQVG